MVSHRAHSSESNLDSGDSAHQLDPRDYNGVTLCPCMLYFNAMKHNQHQCCAAAQQNTTSLDVSLFDKMSCLSECMRSTASVPPNDQLPRNLKPYMLHIRSTHDSQSLVIQCDLRRAIAARNLGTPICLATKVFSDFTVWPSNSSAAKATSVSPPSKCEASCNQGYQFAEMTCFEVSLRVKDAVSESKEVCDNQEDLPSKSFRLCIASYGLILKLLKQNLYQSQVVCACFSGRSNLVMSADFYVSLQPLLNSKSKQTCPLVQILAIKHSATTAFSSQCIKISQESKHHLSKQSDDIAI